MGLTQKVVELLEDEKLLEEVLQWAKDYGYTATEKKFGFSRYIVIKAKEMRG